MLRTPAGFVGSLDGGPVGRDRQELFNSFSRLALQAVEPMLPVSAKFPLIITQFYQ